MAAAALLGAASTSQAIDRVGTREARFRWTAAAGDTTGYVVYVSRDGGAFVAEKLVGSNSVTVAASRFGEQIVLQVRSLGVADAGHYILGPQSPLSDPVSFVEPPQLDGDGAFVLRCIECGELKLRTVEQGAEGGQRVAPPENWDLVATGDVDGDGAPDLVWHDPEYGSLIIELRTALAYDYATAIDPALRRLEVRGVGDFDGDGADDLVLAEPGSGEAEIWTVIGGDVVLAGVVPGPAGNDLVGVADFSGDGVPDLLWLGDRVTTEIVEVEEPAPSPGGLLGIFGRLLSLLTGGGSTATTTTTETVTTVSHGLSITITGGTDIELGPEVGSDRTVLGVADYDDDGAPDVLWRDGSEESLVVWSIRAGALLDEFTVPTQPGDADQVVTSHDFFGGSGAEIALQSRTTGRITLLDASGNRVIYADPGLRWHAVAVLE